MAASAAWNWRRACGEPAVGGKADAAQLGQVLQQPHAEVARVVDGGLGPQGLPFLVVLLDA